MNLVRKGAVDGGLSPVVQLGLGIRLEANDMKSYAGRGTVWTNLAEDTHKATLLNGATFNSSNGGWFNFDGLDESAQIGESITDWAMTTTPITLQTWIYFDSLTNASLGACGVLGKQSDLFSFDGYSVNVGPSGELRILTNGTAISKTSISAHDVMTTQTWQMITVILSISASAGTVRGYRNSTQVINSFHGSDTCNESNSLVLGRAIQRASTPTFLDGRIGAFYAYKRQLTDQEILTNFNATRRRFGV